MAVDQSFLVKHLFDLGHLYVICSGSTRRPFAVCTEDTFEDQLFLFETKELMEQKGKELTEQHYATVGVEIPKADNGRRKFFVDAHYMGFTQISFTDASGEHILPLKSLVDVEKEMRKVPLNRRPMRNQALQITSLYFVQELNRDMPREENPGLADLMDELEHNLAIAPLILAGNEVDDPANPGKKRVGVVNLEGKNDGKKFIPVFSDAMEFAAFSVQNKTVKGFPTNMKMLQTMLSEEADTLILNPTSIQLRIQSKLVARINQRPEVNGK